MNILLKGINKIFPKYQQLPTHIKRLYIITFLGELYLIIPIWMFFYLRFLSFEQVALITIIQQVTAILFEVPTGAFADIFGKRKTLIICYILYSISLILMPLGAIAPLGTTFLFFTILEVLKGIAKALYSGSFEALSYDSLKEIGSEKLYPALSSNLTTVSWIAYIIAGLLGGIMYDIWFGLPYIILGFLYVINIFIIIFSVKEPKIDSVKVTLDGYIKQNMEGFKELFSNSKLTFITITLVLITLGYYTASELLGISQGREYGLSGTEVGLIFTCGYIVSVILSTFFEKILEKYSAIKVTVTTTISLLTSFLLAKFVSPAIGASLIVLRISSSSTFSNVRSVILNKQISSKNRSTALSSFALMYELGYVVIAYFAGSYIGTHSPNDFALILGLILLGSIVFVQLLSFLIHSLKATYNKVA